MGDPLSLNLYTYCGNNPISYHDPSGHAMIPMEGSKLNEWKNKLVRGLFKAINKIIESVYGAFKIAMTYYTAQNQIDENGRYYITGK